MNCGGTLTIEEPFPQRLNALQLCTYEHGLKRYGRAWRNWWKTLSSERDLSSDYRKPVFDEYMESIGTHQCPMEYFVSRADVHRWLSLPHNNWRIGTNFLKQAQEDGELVEDPERNGYWSNTLNRLTSWVRSQLPEGTDNKRRQALQDSAFFKENLAARHFFLLTDPSKTLKVIPPFLTLHEAVAVEAIFKLRRQELHPFPLHRGRPSLDVAYLHVYVPHMDESMRDKQGLDYLKIRPKDEPVTDTITDTPTVDNLISDLLSHSVTDLLSSRVSNRFVR